MAPWRSPSQLKLPLLAWPAFIGRRKLPRRLPCRQHRLTPSSPSYLRNRRRHPKKNRLRRLHRQTNRLSSQFKSQLLPRGRRMSHRRRRDRRFQRIEAQAIRGRLPIRRLETGSVRRTLFTLTKRGEPSRPGAADSSSPLMTVAMPRMSQSPRALEARFSTRLPLTRSIAGVASRAHITGSLCRLPTRCKAPSFRRNLML